MAMFSATKLQVATYLLGVCPFSIAFLVFLNSMVSFVVTDLVGQQDGVGDAVGSLGFADELLALMACPIWGLLSDRIGVRYVCVCGYIIIGLALVLFVQARNVYPHLLLGRLFFALGGSACSTMVTAVLPAVSSLPGPSSYDGGVNTAGPVPPDRTHAPSPSIASELTITPERFRAPGFQQQEGTKIDPYVSTSRVAGFVGMFTGCGALIALLLFLPLPARFQDRGMAPDKALKHSFYIVAAVAFFLSVWCFIGLRKLAFEDDPKRAKQKEKKKGLKEQFTFTGQSLKVAILAGFKRSDIALGYLGGFVARASSVGISLFIPLLVNGLFLSSHLCKVESAADSPEGLPSLKRKCPQAYILAAELTGVCEMVALIAAPFFGYAASRTSRKGVPMMVASAAGIIGYCLLPNQLDPNGDEKGKRAAAFIAVSLIGISQIGAIVCSLGVLGSGVLAEERHSDQTPNDTAERSYEEHDTLLSPGISTKEHSLSLPQLKGSVAGIYSFYGGAAILILTKLGGLLFDRVSFGAPFYIMAVFNGLLLGACGILGWRKTGN